MLIYVGLSLDIWLLLYIFLQMLCNVMLLVAATLLKMVSVCTDSHQIQNTDEFGRLQWSTPEQNGQDRLSTRWCVAHTLRQHNYFDRGLYHHFDLTIRQTLLADAVPTIFLLSKKANVQQKKRGAFEKRERIRISLSQIVLTWTWSCHGWRNTVACACHVSACALSLS